MSEKLINEWDLFGVSDKNFNEELAKLGFETEKELLRNLDKLNLKQLKEVIDYAFDNFDYSEEELQKTIMYLFRGIFEW